MQLYCHCLSVKEVDEEATAHKLADGLSPSVQAVVVVEGNGENKVCYPTKSLRESVYIPCCRILPAAAKPEGEKGAGADRKQECIQLESFTLLMEHENTRQSYE